MTFPPNLRLFGDLKVIEIYEFYDAPVLLSYRAGSGTIYLAVAVGETPTSEEWLYVALSPERFSHVRSGGLDLRSAFNEPENHVTFLVSVPHDENIEASLNPLLPPLPDNLLPAQGEFLRLETATLPPPGV